MGGKKCRKVMIRGAAKYLQYSHFSVDADVDLLDCALPPLPPPRTGDYRAGNEPSRSLIF